MLKRIVANKVNTFVKLDINKFLISPILLYVFTYLTAGRAEIKILQKFQKKDKWITGKKIQNTKASFDY